MKTEISESIFSWDRSIKMTLEEKIKQIRQRKKEAVTRRNKASEIGDNDEYWYCDGMVSALTDVVYILEND